MIVHPDRVAALDTETLPFRDGLKVPPLVCLSWATVDGFCLSTRHDAEMWARHLLSDVYDILVSHNAAYDMAVLCQHVGTVDFMDLVMDAYAAGRIVCTLAQEKLIDISRGTLEMPKKDSSRYSLEVLAKKYLDRHLVKDGWRNRYGELYEVPLRDWPADAVEYPKEDARAHRDLYLAQVAELERKDETLAVADAGRQSAYEFALQLTSAHGFRADAERVARMKSSLEEKVSVLRKKLVEIGLVRYDPPRVLKSGPNKGMTIPEDYVRDAEKIRAAVSEAYGGDPPTTDGGNVATDRDTLVNAPEHEELRYLADFVEAEKLLSTYVPVMEEGTRIPIQPSFHILATGRRGANKNVQTMPRDPGARECHVPRPGYGFIACDADSFELRTWSQVMVDLFGVENVPMAQLYRSDPNADPHTKFGAESFLGVTYEEGLRLKKVGDKAMKNARQGAKAANFGLPGGLGPATLRATAQKGYGFKMTLEEAKVTKKKWLEQWNAQPYFDYVHDQISQKGYIVQHRSDRVRACGEEDFCSACNSLFQGLAADAAYHALFRVQRLCFTNRKSPLFGSRCWNISHDEIFTETPLDRITDAAYTLRDAMNAAMQEFCPDVPMTSSPSITDCWTKDAKEVFGDDGRLTVYHVPTEDLFT